MLFNTASLQSQIAKFQNFDSDEGLKNAAKHFQVHIICAIDYSDLFTSHYVVLMSTFTMSNCITIIGVLQSQLVPGCIPYNGKFGGSKFWRMTQIFEFNFGAQHLAHVLQ